MKWRGFSNLDPVNSRILALLFTGILALSPLGSGQGKCAQAAPTADLADGSSQQESAQDSTVADMDITELVQVWVSPFEVSTNLDRGYWASNSISASRFDASIIELPFAIQAFNHSFIQDQKPVNLFDVARYSPGVTYRSNDFNEGNANLAIRGFAVSATKGNIQVLRDGFHGPSIFDFTNIERVEIVKGPASFLYGQVAPGGIVNVITKKPRTDFGGTTRVRYGSYDEYRLETDVTGPAAERVFYRLALSYDQDIRYWKPYDAFSRAVAPSLRWQVNDQVEVSVQYENYHKQETPQVMQKPGYYSQAGLVPTPEDPNRAGVEVPGLPNDWNSMSDFDFRNSDFNGLNAWVDLRAGENWNIRSAFSHQDYEVDAVMTGNFGMSDNETFLQGRRVRGQTYSNCGQTYETEATGKYQLDGMSLQLLVGLQYIERSFDDWAAQAPNDPELGTDPIGSPLPLWDLRDPSTWDRRATVPRSTLTEFAADRTTDFRDRSLYFGTTAGFLDDRLKALAGGRVTHTESQVFDHIENTSSTLFSASETTPQLGLLYEWRPGVTLFASYAQSFVPGAQILRLPDGTTHPADPTSGRGYDVGVKANLWDGKLSGTLTHFMVRNEDIVNDLAFTDSTGAVSIFNVQSGSQRSRGLELDLTLTHAENWQTYLSYSYMDARILEFTGHDDALLATDPETLDDAGRANYRNALLLHDANLQMSAPHLINLWTRYQFGPGPLEGLFLAGGFNRVEDQTLLPEGLDSSHQSYTLVNILAGYSWQAWGHEVGLDVMGKNLTDEYYRPSQSSRCRPREVLVSFHTQF